MMIVDKTRYYDEDGLFLWEDKLQFKRLWAVGDPLIEEGRSYSICRVAVADNIQYVNVSTPSDCPETRAASIEDAEPAGIILAPYVHIPDEIQATLKPEALLELHEILDEALGLLGPENHIHVTAELDEESRLTTLLTKAVLGLKLMEREEIVEMLDLLKAAGRNETDPLRIMVGMLYTRFLEHEIEGI